MKITKLQLHLTEKMSGKMKGFQNFSVASDQFCAKLAKVQGSVCQKCYANNMRKCYKDLDRVLKENFNKLNSTNEKLDWPILNQAFFRLSAFGDVQNKRIINHYWDLIETNKHVVFALWTKNIKDVNDVIRKRGKPSNLILIRSSVMLNKPNRLPMNFNKVFTVYDKETIAQGKVKINCGAKSCITCRKCYDQTNTEIYINEKLK